MTFYNKLAEKLIYISPESYKKRFFKELRGLTVENVFSRAVEPEMLWIKNTLKKDDVFFDVGANNGAFIFLLESIIISENYYAFEPNKALYARLKKIFPNVKTFDIALSDNANVADFKIPTIAGKSFPTRGTLEIRNREKGETAADFYKVNAAPLDEWIKTHKLERIDFIKIDVEGHEQHTLRGAKDTIRRFRPKLMVEIEQRHHNFPIWNIVEMVQNWEYTANYLDRKTLMPVPLSKEFLERQNPDNVKVYDSYINNIIFLPKL